MKNWHLVFKATLATIPFSLFTGILLAGALASLIPQVDYVAYPFLSTHGNKVISETWQFSLPGEVRLGITHFLVDPQGNKKEITFRVTVYAVLIYTFILMLASMVITGISMARRKTPFNEIVSHATFESALVFFTVSAGIVVIIVLFFAAELLKDLLATW